MREENRIRDEKKTFIERTGMFIRGGQKGMLKREWDVRKYL